MFREAYREGNNIQQSTLHFVNDFFGEYGLLVLIPDNANLKKLFANVAEEELTRQFSRGTVREITAVLEEQYKVQAPGRELNLFYLIDDKRERIEPDGSGFKVEGLKLKWNKEEILEELKQYPERFSPNVILRGIFQETILPNVAFIGGGGELAYWLELKKVFAESNTPYPVLLLRNSFLLAKEMWKQKAEKLSLDLKDFFASEHEVMTKIVARHSSNRVRLNGQLKKFEDLYNEIISFTTPIDITLNEHVAALRTKAIHKLQELEKKILRAEKRKFDTELRQIRKIKSALFPNNSLQERVENITGFYSKYGKELIDVLFQYSPGITSNFGIISIS
jgi:bacillithiol biosynthesis cysteine-adding enzyme BshC